MKNVTGGGLPATIWNNFMRIALAGKPVIPLPTSPGDFDIQHKDHDTIWDTLLEHLSKAE